MKKINQYLIIFCILVVVLILAFAVNHCANNFSQKIEEPSDSIHIKNANTSRDSGAKMFDAAKAQIKELEGIKGSRAYLDSLIRYDSITRARIRKELGLDS